MQLTPYKPPLATLAAASVPLARRHLPLDRSTCVSGLPAAAQQHAFVKPKMFAAAFLLVFVLDAVFGHPTGAGQCSINASGDVNGMATRNRTGQVLVTVTPNTAAPGKIVTVTATAMTQTGLGNILGLLSAVYAGMVQVGTHSSQSTNLKSCMGDETAITHEKVLFGSSFSWQFTIPRDQAAGVLNVRVVTLNGAVSNGTAGSKNNQAFAFESVNLTVQASNMGMTAGAPTFTLAPTTSTLEPIQATATSIAKTTSIASIAASSATSESARMTTALPPPNEVPIEIIAGSVGGGLFALLLLVAGVVVYLKRHRSAKAPGNDVPLHRANQYGQLALMPAAVDSKSYDDVSSVHQVKSNIYEPVSAPLT